VISQRIRAFLWIFSYIKNYNKIFSKEKTSEVCPSANSHYLLQLFHLNCSVFTLQDLNYVCIYETQNKGNHIFQLSPRALYVDD